MNFDIRYPIINTLFVWSFVELMSWTGTTDAVIELIVYGVSIFLMNYVSVGIINATEKVMKRDSEAC